LFNSHHHANKRFTWKGKEEQMLSHLITKYKRRIPPPIADHLRTLSEYVETQTESSFVR